MDLGVGICHGVCFYTIPDFGVCSVERRDFYLIPVIFGYRYDIPDGISETTD